ncbi:MAG: cytochrome c [Planctomycetes bacterium]|nr:cytochrome c [Planctomycetota bacterium]
MRCVVTSAVLCLVAFGALQLAGLLDSAPRQASALAVAGAAPTVSDFMLVVHGTKGLRGQIDEATKGGGPSDEKAWRTLKARSAVLVYLTETILKPSVPEKGSKASWNAKVGEYLKTAKAVAKAAGDEDLDGITVEVAKLTKGCEGCHKAHR